MNTLLATWYLFPSFSFFNIQIISYLPDLPLGPLGISQIAGLKASQLEGILPSILVAPHLVKQGLIVSFDLHPFLHSQRQQCYSGIHITILDAWLFNKQTSIIA